MSRGALIRAGGMAAIVGGILRAAASFAPGVGSELEQQMLYLLVDLLLLVGLLGFYELRYQDVGRIGAFGFLLALLGVIVVRSSRAIPGLDLYPAGALAFAGGLILLCGRAWRVRVLTMWVPAALIISTLAGLMGTAAAGYSGWPFVVSGVSFGAAFIGLGREMWSASV